MDKKNPFAGTTSPSIPFMERFPLPKYGSTNLLAELSQNPTARKNKYDELRRQFDSLERHADFLETRLKDAEKRGSQPAYNAILKQLQNAETRINNLATEMNSIAESSRYSAEQERRQQKIDARKPKTTMDKVRESLPYAIGSGIRDLIVDTGKGLGRTALYAENQLRTGKAGTQLNPNTMQMEDIQFGDVADTYIKGLGKNTGTYLDALNSLGYWGATGRFGSKPDSQDERFRNMIGDAVPRIFGTKDIEDPTVAKGAEIVADPFVVGSRVKAGVDAVTDPKLWESIARDMSMGTRSHMFMPVIKWSNKGRDQVRATNNPDDWLGGYTPQIQDAYKKFEELSAQGVDPREIFRQTRIFKNVDGIPYFETDDSLATIDADGFRRAVAKGSKGFPLSAMLMHPELSASDYAFNAQRQKFVVPQSYRGAGYNPSTGIVETYPEKITDSAGNIVDEVPSNIIHETNHMLSNDASLRNSGSNPDMANIQLNEYKRDIADLFDILAVKHAKIDAKADSLYKEYNRLDGLISNSIDSASATGLNIPSNELDVLIRQRRDVYKKIEGLTKKKLKVENRVYNDIKLDALQKYNLYMRNNAEALSRLAEARMGLDDTARRDTFVMDNDYFKSVTGYTPDQTWFNKYDINKSIYENDLVFPDDIATEILNYLDKGTKPFDYRRMYKVKK